MLANKILPSNHSFESFLKPAVLETIFLRPTHKSELREICMSFKNGRVSGYDNIPIVTISTGLYTQGFCPPDKRPLSHVTGDWLYNKPALKTIQKLINNS